MRIDWKHWKKTILLLLSTSFGNIGNFIYLVAINLLVYQKTGSSTYVAMLWMISPAVNLLTKFWIGGLIDHKSQRKIMLISLFARAFLIFLIPFLTELYLIFLILIFLSGFNSFFVPASATYIAKFVPVPLRKRFNSIQSLSASGAFIVGPAIAGMLILWKDIEFTLMINAFLFVASALILWFLPEVENQQTAKKHSFTPSQIRRDWQTVLGFMKEQGYVTFIYSMYLAGTVFSFAMDAQEVVFAKGIVGLSEMEYSLLISITGIGSIVGAFLVTLFSQKIPLRMMISIGLLMEATGYLCYAFSWSFFSIALGFTILGLFNAFTFTGITTFYQNNIPSSLFGRVTSIFQLYQSLMQISVVFIVGVIGDIIPLRMTIITLALGMVLVSFLAISKIIMPSKRKYFDEQQS